MFFILLTFAAALFIEGLGSLVSVIGISALFGANPIIIALAISLDVGKIVTVSFLYTHWKEMPKLMKGYALLAAAVTMIITSAGAAGYLSGEFQKAIQGSKEGELKVNVLKDQQAKYEERKKQIDDQIATLPPRTTVNQRLRLMNGFKAEQQRLDAQIQVIDKQLPELQITQIGTEAKAGPILAIAKAFKISVEEAVKWVIAAIIFVFDPLAIFLIIAGNYLWAKRIVRIESEYEDDVDGISIMVDDHPKSGLKPVGWQDHVVEDFAKPKEPSVREPDPIPDPSPPVVLEQAPPEEIIAEPEEVHVSTPDRVIRSSLADFDADTTTIVDASNVVGFRQARALVPPTKKP